MFRKLSFLAVLLVVLCVSSAVGAEKQTIWVFFDLGKTLIDHARDYSSMRYLPGTHDYLRGLRSRGYYLGLLVNWPENEGTGNKEKLQLLKEFIKPKWTDREPFDWTQFECVLFPSKDIYRKPHPFLFIEALRAAAPHPVVYQGEDWEEIQAARKLGLTAHCVGNVPGGASVSARLSADEIAAQVRETFIFTYPGHGD